MDEWMCKWNAPCNIIAHKTESSNLWIRLHNSSQRRLRILRHGVRFVQDDQLERWAGVFFAISTIPPHSHSMSTLFPGDSTVDIMEREIGHTKIQQEHASVFPSQNSLSSPLLLRYLVHQTHSTPTLAHEIGRGYRMGNGKRKRRG